MLPFRFKFLLLFLRPEAVLFLWRFMRRPLPAAYVQQLHQPVVAHWGWFIGLKKITHWYTTVVHARWQRMQCALYSNRWAAYTQQGVSRGQHLLQHPSQRTRLVVIGANVLISLIIIAAPLSLNQQWLLSAMELVLAVAIARSSYATATLLLIGLSILVTGRYVWWRVTETLDFINLADAVAGSFLLAAEAYFGFTMLLSYLQLIWPLEREIVAMPTARHAWPHIDVFIPTYNEPLDVVRPTVLAAQNLDWPPERLHIYLLDDGRRHAFDEFAQAAGVHYVIRPDNRHAKAGNINHALSCSSSAFIAIFDCDHIPTRNFLQATMGWMLRDPLCALVQTPHYFFSPDPIERNLGMHGSIPNEGKLFYGLVQNGNDLWNATFFCGSCAVLRRTPLLEIGGVAVETVTEDAHTALKLHRHGYNTTYLPQTLAAGLATESLSGHVAQRIRWARGMAQIFRIDNPFLGRGLSAMQRLCYASAMLHFFYGLPRLILLTAPLTYLIFGLHMITTEIPTLLAYFLPHFLVNKFISAKMQGSNRASFWGEIYELILAWYLVRPTTVALLAPGHGRFNVTVKGGLVKQHFFDWKIAVPYLVLISANFLGISLGLMQLLVWDTPETAVVIINMVWALYNLLTLGVAANVAVEKRQIRKAHRVQVQLNQRVRLCLANGTVLSCDVRDFSLGGIGLHLSSHRSDIQHGDHCIVQLNDGDNWHTFPAHIARVSGLAVSLQFEPLSLDDERALLRCTFSHPEIWNENTHSEYHDRPWKNWTLMTRLGLSGYRHLLGFTWNAMRHALRTRWS